MRTVGVAVAGVGFIGPVHIEAVRRLGHRVVGILGSTHEKGQVAATRLGVPIAYSSFAELLADPAVEVVHLATPNCLHFEQARASLAAGKHVICEKPLAMNSTETAELVKLAAANPHLITAVNYNIRFYPLCLEARTRIQSGELGDLFHIAGSYLQDWLLHSTDYNWRVTRAEGGALRAVADIGTHWLDLVSFITGQEVEAVCADLRTVHPVRQKPRGGSETFRGSASGERCSEPVAVDTEDCGSILLRYHNGVRGCLTVSQVTAGRKNCLRFEIAGSKSSIAWNSEEPNLLHIGHRDRANETLIRDPALLSKEARSFSCYPGGHAEGFPDSHKQLFHSVYDAIVEKPTHTLYPTFSEGHREVLLCEAILQSHHEQRWISLPSGEPR